MFRKKGFSAKQSKGMSRRMKQSFVGTHVKREKKGRPHHMNAENVSFSNMRKQQKATQGQVDAFIPSTSTRESHVAYAQRVNHQSSLAESHKKQRRRRIVAALIVVVLLVILAIGVGIFAYFGTLDSEMALRNSDAPEALVAPKTDTPFYVLVAADLGSVSESLDAEGPDALILAYIDEQNESIEMIAIPPELRILGTDNNFCQLRDKSVDGDAALIRAVADFANVTISHYIELDAQGVVGFVDALGGITVTLDTEIDDPHAGDVYLASGDQTINGQGALTLLRATNIPDGIQGKLKNQALFAREAVRAVFSRTASSSSAAVLDLLGAFFQTDLSAGEIVAFLDAFANIPLDSVVATPMPGSVNTQAGTTTKEGLYVADTEQWRSLIERIQTESEPVEPETPAAVDPASFTLTVQNGTTITGAAASTAEQLTARGFDVAETGNAEQAIYEETLVIYDGDKKPQADAVIDALGFGRAVNGAGYYTYDTDILLILGADFKPSA